MNKDKRAYKLLPIRALAERKAKWLRAARVSGTSASDIARDALDKWADKVLAGENHD